MLKIIDDVEKMKVYARVMRKNGKMIGLVPTMGCLHEGHLSLMNAARKQTDIVVTSIFVNPIQFGQNEDFKKYPRDIKSDELIVKNLGVDVLFCPHQKDMYPKGYSTHVDVGKMGNLLCGRSRPGHFKGVATVVTKLFEIVKPDIAYFGQKDVQQAVIIRKMTNDLDMDVVIKVLPIIREKDGLAMSSRNTYLKKEERGQAVCLFTAINRARELFADGLRDTHKIIEEMKKVFEQKDLAKVEYINIVDMDTLKDLKTIKDKAVCALAVRIGKTRLIDNTILGVEDEQNAFQ